MRPLMPSYRLGLILLLANIAVMTVLLVRPLLAWMQPQTDWVKVAEVIEAREPACAQRLQTVTSRIAYTLTPGSPAGTAQADIRYRMVLFVNVNNLTNRSNYRGFSGVMTSPFFRKATAVNNPRRIDFGMNVNF